MLRIKDGDEHRPKRSADVSDRHGVSPAEGGVGPSRAGLTWLGFGCPQDLFMVLSMQKKKKDPPVANLPFFRSCVGFNKDLRDSFLCN